MVEGLDREITTATAYAWLIWEKDRLGSCELFWVPSCREELERDEDYDLAPKMWSRRHGGPITAPSIAPSDHLNEDRIVVSAATQEIKQHWNCPASRAARISPR
jgi:hypothetical protein